MFGGNFFCDFTTKANSAHTGASGDPFVSADLAGVVSDTGHVFNSAGAWLPGIRNGLLMASQDSTSGGYAYIDLGRTPLTMTTVIKYDTGQGTVIACGRTTPTNLDYNQLTDTCHIQMNQNGYDFQVRLRGQSAGAENGFNSIDSFTYAPALKVDGTFYTVSVTFNKSGAIVTLADGTVRKVYSPWIGQAIGRFLMFQAECKIGSAGGIKSVAAIIGSGRQIG